MKLIKGISVLSAAVLLAACGSDDDDDNGPTPGSNAPSTYTFQSKVVDGESSVSYTGQTTRQALIAELSSYIKSSQFQAITDKDDAVAALNRIYLFGTKASLDNPDGGPQTFNNLKENNLYTGAQGDATDLSINAGDGNTLLQEDFSQLGESFLAEKTAGIDNALSMPFVGWNVTAQSVTVPGKAEVSGDRSKPYLLLQQWFDAVATESIKDSGDVDFLDETNGLDYQQLIEKFLLGAVTYSQAAEDYLASDGGLNNGNDTDSAGSNTYTSLEHQWDEGFGYFGASRDYNLITDEVKNGRISDTNGDTEIDLKSEYSFGLSRNAASRDLGSTDPKTDFTKAAMDALLEGRQIIQDNFGTNPVEGEGYHTELVEQSGIALRNWENAIAATVVHYINDTSENLEAIKADGRDAVPAGESKTNFELMAKHWGEMKGFALGLQFSPRATLTAEQQVMIHNYMGEKPKFEDAEIDAYVADLEKARDIFQQAYGFSQANVEGW